MDRWYVRLGAVTLAVLLGVAMSRGSSRLPRDGRCSSRDGSCSNGFNLAQNIDFTVTGTLPSCTGVPACHHICFATGTPDYQCFDNTGAQIAGMVQGTTSFGGFFSPGNVLLDSVDNGPKLTSAILNDFWASGDYEIQIFDYVTTKSTTVPMLYEGSTTTNALQVRVESGALKCIFTEDNGGVFQFPTPVSTNLPVDGWAVTTCRRSGTHHFARVNGGDGTDVALAPGTLVAGTGGYESFGWAASSLTNPGRGPNRAIIVYTDGDLSGTRAAINEKAFWGNTKVVGSTNNQLLGLDNLATNGQVDMYGPGSAMMNATGIRTTSGFTNTWAADPLSAASATAVGTPTITANTTAGPFSRWHNANEADLLADTSAVAFQGIQASASMGAATGWYTVSCYVAAGTSGVTTTKARLTITTDGTGVVPCDFTGLTSTFQRIACSMNIGGAPTTIKGQLLVGNALADTGSVLVSQCQQQPRPYANTPVVDNVAKGASNLLLDPSSWPLPGQHGKYEIVFDPYSNENSTWDIANPLYLFDANITGIDHTVAIVFGYTSPGLVLATSRDGLGGSTDLLDNAGTMTLVPNTPYVVSMEWTPHGSGHCDLILRYDACGATPRSQCHATTIHKSLLDGTGICPGTPNSVRLGNRNDNSAPTEVSISYVRISS